jgi:hypothetical protein
MAITLASMPVDQVVEDPEFPDREGGVIFDHLLRYLRHFDPLPAITVIVRPDGVIITRGHKYLAAARVLGRDRIWAVVASPEESPAVRGLFAERTVARLDWDSIRAEEGKVSRPRGWHVTHFRRPLGLDERNAFIKAMEAVFEVSLTVVFESDYAEFEADTPVSDAVWAARHLAALREFSGEVVTVASYQGRRFEVGK